MRITFFIILVLLSGCQSNIPTRTVLNCEQPYVISDKTVFIGGSLKKGSMVCFQDQIPIPPEETQLIVDPALIDK